MHVKTVRGDSITSVETSWAFKHTFNS